jgi:hypothetical protein
MGYNYCDKAWLEGNKEHHCHHAKGHFMSCECSCGARKLIREVPLRVWTPKPQGSRRNRRPERED